MRSVIFSDNVASALRGWHHTAKKHMKQGRASASSTPFSSRSASPLHGSTSPLYLLQGYKKSYHEDGAYDQAAMSREEWGRGGEVALASAGRHDVEDDFDRKDRLSEISTVIEIERDVEDPPSQDLGIGNQHRGQISLDAFSFRKKENES